MPPTIVPTVGSASANSYATEAETDTYALGTEWAASWAASTTKAALLVRAQRALDSYARFIGRRTDDTQALEWPRYGVYGPSGTLYSSTAVPQAIKNAQMHLACWLAAQTATDVFSSASTPLNSLTAGEVSLEFRQGAEASGVAFFNDVIVPILRAARCITFGSPVER